MSGDYIAVITSPGAKEIETYCYSLAQELGLTLAYTWWGYAEHPGHRTDPYNLHLSVSKPCKADPQFWFTREQVLGYAKGTTKTAIQSEISTALHIRLRDDL